MYLTAPRVPRGEVYQQPSCQGRSAGVPDAVEFAALDYHYGKLNVRSRGEEGAPGAPARQFSDR